MKRTLLVGVTCLVIGGALGLARQTYFVYGRGMQSCGKWTSDGAIAKKETLDAVSRWEAESWVVGFVSGVGYEGGGSYRKTDAAGIVAWMDAHCAANPLETIATATEKLVKELQTSR